MKKVPFVQKFILILYNDISDTSDQSNSRDISDISGSSDCGESSEFVEENYICEENGFVKTNTKPLKSLFNNKYDLMRTKLY